MSNSFEQAEDAVQNSKIQDSAVEVFLKSWQVYQDIIAHNYMFHREISVAARSALTTFKPDRSLRVLDLGCGDASMVLPLLSADRVSRYIGCDLSQPALDIARTQLDAQQIPNQLICDDMLLVASELPNASADVVFSSYAIHHLNAINKQRILEDIARVLVPGGCLVLIDIFREPEEDRTAYMRNYMGVVLDQWANLSPESRDLVIDHATAYDFPEHPRFYETQCIGNGFAPGTRLAKHTWHEAWLYCKPRDA